MSTIGSVRGTAVRGRRRGAAHRSIVAEEPCNSRPHSAWRQGNWLANLPDERAGERTAEVLHCSNQKGNALLTSGPPWSSASSRQHGLTLSVPRRNPWLYGLHCVSVESLTHRRRPSRLHADMPQRAPTACLKAMYDSPVLAKCWIRAA